MTVHLQSLQDIVCPFFFFSLDIVLRGRVWHDVMLAKRSNALFSSTRPEPSPRSTIVGLKVQQLIYMDNATNYGE
jgi:hypothetical protein